MMPQQSLQDARRRRQEGFPGQRLIILPLPVQDRMRLDPTLQDLFVTATGHFPNAPGHYVERRNGIADTIMIRVLHGSGWVEGAARQDALAGELVFIPPCIPHSYGASDADPWMIEWIHFRGACAPRFADLFGASGGIRVLGGDFEGSDFPPFSHIYETLEGGYTPLNLLRTAAHLRAILTEIYARLLDGLPRSAEARVRTSMEWMQAHSTARISLAALANAAGLSVPHYCSLFRRLAGYPPIEHLRRLNIQRACQMLNTSLLPIGEIAARLGWDDPLYFSRCFRRVTGKSPKAWRESYK